LKKAIFALKYFHITLILLDNKKEVSQREQGITFTEVDGRIDPGL
jgi:hypothetical protein